jgi:hypothetical protein
MWTWKTEQAADWSMQAGITYGEIRSDAAKERLDPAADLEQDTWVSTRCIRADARVPCNGSVAAASRGVRLAPGKLVWLVLAAMII